MSRHQPPVWKNARCHFAVPSALREWLYHSQSMTQKLKNHSISASSFCVNVHQQHWQNPHQDETRRLALLPRALVWTREVSLWCDNQPWMYARSTFPKHTLIGKNRVFRRLGTTPLGELLFHSTIQRSHFEFVKLRSKHALYQKSTQLLGSQPPHFLWARRSVFYLHHGEQPFLLTEIFLPDLIRHCEAA